MNYGTKDSEDQNDYYCKLAEIRNLFNVEMSRYNEVFEVFILHKFLDLF